MAENSDHTIECPESISGVHWSAMDTVYVYPEGDCTLAVAELAGTPGPFGLRVSSQALMLSSAIFKNLLAPVDSNPSPFSADNPKVITVADDGDALLLLLNVLHLCNDVLPARIPAELLFKFCKVVATYDCAIAASRAASQWFDYLYTKATIPLTFEIIEAACLLNDAIWFARFTSRWVLTEPFGSADKHMPVPEPARERLLSELRHRQKIAADTIKADIDLMVTPCAEALSSDASHIIDVAPGGENPDGPAEPKDSDVICLVDKEGAVEYFAALRDVSIWPAPSWKARNIGELVETIKNFRIPEYDTSDSCHWCMEIHVKFPAAVKEVRRMHQGRLWGLCLECFKVGAVSEGECRYGHLQPALHGAED